MNTSLHLEVFLDGTWRRIGWDASTNLSKMDLRDHGDRLAATGGFYRLVSPSIYADGPDEIVHTYSVISPVMSA